MKPPHPGRPWTGPEAGFADRPAASPAVLSHAGGAALRPDRHKMLFSSFFRSKTARGNRSESRKTDEAALSLRNGFSNENNTVGGVFSCNNPFPTSCPHTDDRYRSGAEKVGIRSKKTAFSDSPIVI
ncbi:hypothetical protein FHS78_002545 [Parvibaculum indicum]|uniref:hypothetical protein n=1 Tax=Parvibaculum indicum TaxID=562969 RepID=UPI00141DFAC5|nr:hypothetical protein [Parvibaculum indicum]NIJ42252.1 hypothetical protein [Parvibaculum indicum]